MKSNKQDKNNNSKRMMESQHKQRQGQEFSARVEMSVALRVFYGSFFLCVFLSLLTSLGRGEGSEHFPLVWRAGCGLSYQWLLVLALTDSVYRM
jgi:hypothetical protein